MSRTQYLVNVAFVHVTQFSFGARTRGAADDFSPGNAAASHQKSLEGGFIGILSP
jgi:hypothetical protein